MTLTRKPTELVHEAESLGSPGLLAKDITWARVALGDVAEVVNGCAFPSKFFNDRGDGLPLVRIRNVGRISPTTFYSGPFESRYLVHPGDILVGMDGEFRVSEWRGPISLLNQRVCRLDIRDSESYDRRFIVLVLQGYLDAIWSATSSITVKHLSSRSVQEIPLPLPPIAEQRRIVATLDDYLSRIDTGCTVLTSAMVRITQRRDRFIATTCTGNFAPTESAARPPKYAGVQDGKLPPLPDGWKWLRLGEIADIVGGITKDAKRQVDAELPEVPYLRVANVQRGHLNLDHVAVIRAPADRIRKLHLQKGDVLLNEGGDRDKLGRGWIWEGQLPVCIHQNHVFRARIRNGRLEPKLLAWHANTFGKEWCERNGKQSVNLASISLSKIRLLPVPVPPQDEQSDLVGLIENHLVELDRLYSALQRALQGAEHLRRSLLIDAFAGRLVPQDPEDEPASVLLKRIEADRVDQPTARRGRGTPKKPNEQGNLL